MIYAELHCHSYYSLLDAASSPEALVTRAVELGLPALALTDHYSLAGVIRFATAARRHDLHPVIGAEVTLENGHHLTLLAETQTGYANLSRLITAARLDQVNPVDRSPSLHRGEGAGMGGVWPGKISPALTWEKLAAHSPGLIALSGCRRGPIAAPLLQRQPQQAQAATANLLEIFGPQHLFIELQHHLLPDDDQLISQLLTLAHTFNLQPVATNNVHYATPAASLLRDALIAIDHNQTLSAARQAGALPLNSNYALPTPLAMTQRFRHLPAALANTRTIADRCHVSLDFSGQRLPTFPLPDSALRGAPWAPNSEFAYLYHLCHSHLPQRYPQLTAQVLQQLAHELAVIDRAGLAGYFLIVWDVVRFARAAGIRCQGRGSAANSLVAYLLHITSIDPLQHNLLFERFLSPDKFTMPDIDIDFAADRRGEVIQYVYQKYGTAHTAMVCNVVTYQARSALRDLAKALAFPAPVIDRLAQSLDTHSCQAAADQLDKEFGMQNAECGITADHQSALRTPNSALTSLLRQLDGCPRHLSIHSGGMIITGPPLADLVPLEPATMPGRIITQWDKESIEDAGLIKIDLLGLRTLGLITEALHHIQTTAGQTPDLDAIPLDDPALYRLLHQADTIGTFQVESRAQQQMLPRLKPTHFAEIAIQIAIIRPGPIQGGAVHPYLRRRAGTEPVRYLHPTLEPVLAETLGVLLFQEQAIRLAMQVAGFSPGAADLLRRALSRKDATATLPALAVSFVQGAQQQGMDPTTAQAIFKQLAGFAGYGFCKSHAMSFALIAYQTLYLKHYHPVAFYCALLNQQPMGFYSPEVIINDARRHGVTLLPPHINHSTWPYTIEPLPTGQLALRTGLHTIPTLGPHAYAQLAAARQSPLSTAPLCAQRAHSAITDPLITDSLTSDSPFNSLPDLCHRTRLPRAIITNLIRAGACDSWGDRRTLLWQLGDLTYPSDGLDLTQPTTPVPLPTLEPAEQSAWEYELLGYAPSGQLLHHYRPTLQQAGILSTAAAKQQKAGQRIRVAGLIVVRQRPATANGILFISLEDESGLLDVVVKPDLYERTRTTLRSHPLLVIEGTIQRNGATTSLLATDISPFPVASPLG